VKVLGHLSCQPSKKPPPDRGRGHLRAAGVRPT
jgi:hypothetical protein